MLRSNYKSHDQQFQDLLSLGDNAIAKSPHQATLRFQVDRYLKRESISTHRATCYPAFNRRAAAVIALFIVWQLNPSFSGALAAEPLSATAETDEEALTQCHDLTKRILLAIIELERFSLNYRLASMKTPKLVLAQYAANHEAGVAGSFAAAAIGTRQAALGRTHPSEVDLGDLRDGLRASFVTTILAGSSSAVALASNMAVACQHHRAGYNSAQANRFVQSHLSNIDQLLNEREALVAAHSTHRLAPLAVQEGKILRLLRDGCLFEYARFNRNIRNYRVGRNAFYVLNIATSIVKAAAAQYSMRALNNPRCQGPASILAVLTGAMTFASPLLSTVVGSNSGRLAWHSLSKITGGIPYYSPEMLVAEEKSLSESLKKLAPDYTQQASALARAELYTTSSEGIKDELRNEARALSALTKVADQSNVFGPLLGSMAMSQGIVSAVSYYHYGGNPHRQVNLAYSGSVIGLTGSSIGLGANTALLMLALVYIHHLQKTHRMPAALIEYQLQRLNQVEQRVLSL